MQKWEYLRLDIIDKTVQDTELAKMGLQGWELVSVVSITNGVGATRDLYFYFKRPIA